MYKRIAKRIERHEREEKLGITEEEKEILGLNDTDSDESDSDDSDDLERNASEEPDEVGGGDANIEADLRDIEDGQEDEEDEIESIGDLIPPMPIKAALKSPLYDFLGNAKGQGCVICPGKILASQNAADLHVNSSSHKRRLTRFQTYIEQARTKGEVVDLVDASVIVQKMDENIRPPPDQTVAKPKRTSKAPTPGNRKMRRAALRKAKEENGGAVVADAEAKAPSTEDPTAEKAKAKKTNSDSAQSGAVNKSLNKRKHAPGPEGEDKPKKRKTKAPAT